MLQSGFAMDKQMKEPVIENPVKWMWPQGFNLG